jgi:hypothetical protein
MRNRHGGTCYLCGRWVAAGTGHFERHATRWRVKHAIHPGGGRVTCEMARTDPKGREAAVPDRDDGRPPNATCGVTSHRGNATDGV